MFPLANGVLWENRSEFELDRAGHSALRGVGGKDEMDTLWTLDVKRISANGPWSSPRRLVRPLGDDDRPRHHTFDDSVDMARVAPYVFVSE